MPHLEILRWVTGSALGLVLLWAAISDIINRRIPNAAVLTVICLFGLWTLTDQGGGLGLDLAAGGVALAIGYGLYAFKVVGAGDAKLFAAVVLFAGLDHLSLLALATVLSGGVMAVVSLATRPRRAAVMFSLRGKGDFGRGIPYGVAIAFGGLLTIWGLLTKSFPAQILGGRLYS